MGQGCCGSGKRKASNHGVDYSTVAEIAQTTGLEMAELRNYYSEFIKEYPSGEVNKKQFLRLYRKFFPDSGKTKKNANKIFKSFDQDNNGSINFREFMIAISVLSQGTLVQKLSLAFQLYDVNNDGVLTYDEIFEIAKMMYMIAMEQDRMQGLPAPEEFARNLFHELDTDKNGEISLDEFTSVACQDPTMANILLGNINERQAWE